MLVCMHSLPPLLPPIAQATTMTRRAAPHLMHTPGTYVKKKALSFAGSCTTPSAGLRTCKRKSCTWTGLTSCLRYIFHA
jgi:hypothetical protein